MTVIRYADIFAGMGGFKTGFENATKSMGYTPNCVFTSEIKKHAVKALLQNYPSTKITGDITAVNTKDIPDFDILLGGFPCQAFSIAGKRLGFEDTRGTLFFELARILKDKQPMGFIFENVPGLLTHDRECKTDNIGKTFKTILNTLHDLNYNVTYKILNAKDFGVPQERKRVYILGTRKQCTLNLNFNPIHKPIYHILEHNLECVNNNFTQLLLKKYSLLELYGKTIKDKRGGKNNIHSWDIDYFGETNDKEKNLLIRMISERRSPKYSEMYGIARMDGVPLTKDILYKICPYDDLDIILNHLCDMGYLINEYPKQLINKKRVEDTSLPKGYNLNNIGFRTKCKKILDPNGYCLTLTATDMHTIYVPDLNGIRPLSKLEGLRMFGFPDTYKLDLSDAEWHDLLGNTVAVPVIEFLSKSLLSAIF